MILFWELQNNSLINNYTRCKRSSLRYKNRNISLIVKTKDKKQNKVLLIRILYIPSFFINLISSSKLLEKKYYFYGNTQTVNSYIDNSKIALTLIQDGLFPFKLYKMPKISDKHFFTYGTSGKTGTSYSVTLI